MEILGTPVRVKCPKCENKFSRVVGCTHNRMMYACCECYHQFSRVETYSESRILSPTRQPAFS